MDTLLARYFDGELSDREAREFLDAVGSNPKLERELRAYEHVLALGSQLPVPPAPAGFTQRVMSELDAGGGVERGRRWWESFIFRPAPVVFAAAAIILAFIGGWWIAQTSIPPVRTALETSGESGMTTAVTPEVVPVFVNQSPVTQGGYRYVRLAFVPGDSSVSSVQVAGNFNDWDPKTTPLRRQDGVWSTVLVLPPGSYEYMFVVDERQWVTDPLAVETRDDGFGGQNAVLEIDL
jgi:hypothetical protein